MASPTAWSFHDLAKKKMLIGDLDFDGDAFAVRLYSSGSDIGTDANNDASTATNELTTLDGYIAGGTTVNCTVNEAGGTVDIDFTDATWNASGSGLTARFAALIDTTLTPNEIVAHCTLDSTPADVTAAAGKQFTVQFHSSGAGQLT